MQTPAERAREIGQELGEAREQLVRMCARLTGAPDAAEDLAQEALARAFRRSEHLPEPERRRAWLVGIARHVCLDWIRRRRRERAHAFDTRDGPSFSRVDDEPAPGIDEPIDWVADELDLEGEIERTELALLLDRAMGLLPVETRAAFVARYLENASLAEVAGRLGLSEGAVAMRLQRGKLGLRRLLATELRPEAEAFGLVPAGGDAWQETRIWCPSCGRRHLVGRFDDRVYQLRCPDCDAPPGVYFANADLADLHGLLGGVTRFKPALSRLLPWTYAALRQALEVGQGTCARCGAATTVELRMPPDGPPSLRDLPGVSTRCGRCGAQSANSLGIVVRARPEVRHFWKEHPRLRTLPRREVETDGVPAVVSRLESLTAPD